MGVMQPLPAMDRFGRLTRRKSFSLNNNNNSNRNNNRRRGRGNRQQGGGNQNRIDRVQTEYYLQFADHYFRVIADSRPRAEEGRGQRREERDFSNEEDGDEDDFEGQRDGQRGGQQSRQRDDRQQRDDRPREDRPREDRPREDRPREDRQREGRNSRSQRQQGRREDAPTEEGEPGSEGVADAAFEPAENPFVRPGRTRDNRRTRAPRDTANEETAEMTSDAGEIDAAALPPSFSASAESEGEPATTRKLPPRRRRKPADDDGEGDSLTAVG